MRRRDGMCQPCETVTKCVPKRDEMCNNEDMANTTHRIESLRTQLKTLGWTQQAWAEKPNFLHYGSGWTTVYAYAYEGKLVNAFIDDKRVSLKAIEQLVQTELEIAAAKAEVA